MGDRHHLVVVETGGTQQYIFGSNRLAENVGASHLVREATTTWVSEAVDQVPGCRTVVCSSGSSTVLCPTVEAARELTYRITSRALRSAPGLSVHAAFSDAFDWDTDPIHPYSAQARRRLRRARTLATAPAARFSATPLSARCSSSPYPAAVTQRVGPTEMMLSAPAAAKRNAAGPGWNALSGVIDPDHELLTRSVDRLEELQDDREVGWVAVVHADGNGLGDTFAHFDQHVSGTPGTSAHNDAYVRSLAAFSAALTEATESAFRAALRVTPPQAHVFPVVPILVGGDDLTVVCDGPRALELANVFLTEFARLTAEDDRITQIRPGGLTASAGISIVKPHFPFSAGYDIAEQLLRSAKHAKPDAAVDLHVVYDSSSIDLGAVRSQMRLDDQRIVWGGPYLTGSEATPRHRSLSQLDAATAVLNQTEDGRRTVPAVAAQRVRTALRLPAQLAQLVFEEESATHPGLRDLGSLSPDGVPELFTPLEGAPASSTIALDAMALASVLRTLPAERQA